MQGAVPLPNSQELLVTVSHSQIFMQHQQGRRFCNVRTRNRSHIKAESDYRLHSPSMNAEAHSQEIMSAATLQFMSSDLPPLPVGPLQGHIIIGNRMWINLRETFQDEGTTDISMRSLVPGRRQASRVTGGVFPRRPFMDRNNI